MRSSSRRAKLLAPALAAIWLSCSGGTESAPDVRVPYYDLVGRFRSSATTSAVSSAAPLARQDPQVLFLPAGSSVEYLLFIEARSTLQARRIALRGRGVRLRVTIRTDEEGETPVATVTGPAEGAAFALHRGRRSPVRLVLRAEAEAGDGGAGRGVLIEEPAVWGPAAPPPADRPAAVSEPANVIFYVIDTLRRDRLGCYGYERPISPHIDAFAGQATLFVNAFAQSSWTKASMASVLTSTWPATHGALGWKHKLSPDFETLAEVLRGAGYRTAAFMTNPNLVKAYGFDQGFDDFYRKLKISSEAVNELVFEWLDAYDGKKPYFLYVHSMDPHAPYAPPEPYKERFAPRTAEMPSWKPRWKWPLEARPFLSDLYDADIAHNDASFGALIAELRARDLYDDTLVVVVSDHGEEFKEHGKYRHGNNLFGPTLNVPLIVKLPGQREARRVQALAQHVDLMPTVLEVLGLPVPPRAEGRSLAGLGGGPEGRVFSHLRLGRSPLTLSIVDGEWKLVRTHNEDGFVVGLYNWQDDPAESRDRSSELPVRTAVLAQLLAEKITAVPERAAVAESAPDPEVLEALEALGYLR